MCRFTVFAFVFTLCFSTVVPAFGDGPSTASTGINSQTLGLTGAGVNIAMVENTRPGLFNPDPNQGDDASHSNVTVTPIGVFSRAITGSIRPAQTGTD